VAADLAPRQALIADGHHRYAAYLQLQARRRSAGDGGGPWDYGLALLVDSAAYPPQIGAIHRVIPGLAPAAAVSMAESAFRVRSLPAERATCRPRCARSARHRPAAAWRSWSPAAARRTCQRARPGAARGRHAAGQSPRWRGLAASVLQELLMTRGLGRPR